MWIFHSSILSGLFCGLLYHGCWSLSLLPRGDRWYTKFPAGPTWTNKHSHIHAHEQFEVVNWSDVFMTIGGKSEKSTQRPQVRIDPCCEATAPTPPPPEIWISHLKSVKSFSVTTEAQSFFSSFKNEGKLKKKKKHEKDENISGCGSFENVPYSAHANWNDLRCTTFSQLPF